MATRMNHDITRRTAVHSLAAGSALFALADKAQAFASANESFSLPHGTRDERGAWLISFRIIAADDFTPVAGVDVEFNWWGTDGGIRIYATDADGVVTFSERLDADDPDYRQQVYFLHFAPPKHSRFAKSKAEITINADGTYFPNQFTLPFHETELVGMKYYAMKRE